jgi:ornithine cyclodeaminase
MKPRIFTRQQIEQVVDIPALIEAIEQGLILASQGKVSLAPISMLSFRSPPGETHIKSAYIAEDEHYVVKIASGFPNNPRMGLSASQGLMLIFSAQNGILETILLDEGYLTDLRTGIAGAICAKHFASQPICQIGIIGTGNQALMQLHCLRYVTSCRDVLVWGRNPQRLAQFATHPLLRDFNLRTTAELSELCQTSSLIVTTTSSQTPLLFAKDLKRGIHVTAVGADHPGKQEISVDALCKADGIFVDNLAQCLQYGDLAAGKEHLCLDKVQEIGLAIQTPWKRDPEAITIADLTGVAIEDVQIAKMIAHQLQAKIC